MLSDASVNVGQYSLSHVLRDNTGPALTHAVSVVGEEGGVVGVRDAGCP